MVLRENIHNTTYMRLTPPSLIHMGPDITRLLHTVSSYNILLRHLYCARKPQTFRV